jgi:hypothetical protein
MWMGVVTLMINPLSSVAGDHHIPELHISLALPDDWVRMGKPEIEFLNQSRARRPGVRYLAGYRHQAASNDQSPCIIFYQLPTEIRGKTYDDLKRALSKDIDARVEELDRPILDMVLVLPDGSVGLDRHRKRILFGATTEFLDGRSNALTVGYLGLDRVLIVQSFARDQDIRKWAAVFLEAHESIRFDNGFEFDPGARSILSEKLRVVVYGAVFLGFTIAAVRYLIRRNRRLQNPPHLTQQ